MSEGNGVPSIVFQKLSELKAKPIKWLVPGRVPLGKLVLIAGDGGMGKSTLTRQLVARITNGRPAFGVNYKPDEPGRVILFAAEDGAEDVILPSLVAEGADLERVARVPYVTTKGKGKPQHVYFGLEHVGLLKAEVHKRPDVRLIVVDPIASFVGRCRIDDHKQGELRRVLDPLNELAEATGATVLVVAHVNKSNGARAVHRIAGSTGYVNAVRLAYLIGEDPDDDQRRFMMPVKANLLGIERDALAFRLHRLTADEAAAHRKHPAFADLGNDDFAAVAEQMARLEFEGNVRADADRMMATKQPQDKNKVARCREWIKEFLAKYAYPSGEILDAAKAAGFTFDNVKQAKAELRADGLHNRKADGLNGEWWSGFGDPRDWVTRPAATSAPSHTSPGSPTSPTSDGTGGTRVIGGSSVSSGSGEGDATEAPMADWLNASGLDALRG